MTGMEAIRTAAPYLSRFRGQIFVLKLGGEVLENTSSLKNVLEQIALLYALGIKIVLVHGGGTAVDALAAKLNVKTTKVNGRRITDAENLEVVKMTLGGLSRIDLMAVMASSGLPAVSLTGLDAGTLVATKRPVVTMNVEGQDQQVDFGFVGDLTAVQSGLIDHLLQGGYLPVIAPISADRKGQPLNTNADTVAAHVAATIGAEKLIFVLRMPGLLRDASDQSSVVPMVPLEELPTWIDSPAVHGGMLPKLAAAKHALDQGVGRVHLVSGFSSDALLTEIFTNEGSGTMIAKQDS